jgi:hypothetical protein
VQVFKIYNLERISLQENNTGTINTLLREQGDSFSCLRELVKDIFKHTNLEPNAEESFFFRTSDAVDAAVDRLV